MKKFVQIFFICVIGFCGSSSFALEACVGVSTCQSGVKCPIMNMPACLLSSTLYYNNMGVVSCRSCPDGYEIARKTINIVGCSNVIYYNDCVRECTECPDCENVDWTSSSFNSPYEYKITAVCNTATCMCSKLRSYRCKQGYYGTSNAVGTSGCTRCPALGEARIINTNLWFNAYSTTSGPGNGKKITDCFASPLVEYRATEGIYRLTENCNYVE